MPIEMTCQNKQYVVSSDFSAPLHKKMSNSHAPSIYSRRFLLAIRTSAQADTSLLPPTRRAPGGIYSGNGLSSKLHLSGETTFAGNVAENDGGAIYIGSLDQVGIADVAFASNTAKQGGAIYVASSSSGIFRKYENCKFDDNIANNGGAIYFSGGDNGFDSVHRSTFQGNDASKTAVNNRGWGNTMMRVKPIYCCTCCARRQCKDDGDDAVAWMYLWDGRDQVPLAAWV